MTDTFPARLTALREKVGISRNALAVKAGVSPINVSRYEAGEKSPTLATALKLFRALGREGKAAWLALLDTPNGEAT